MLVILRSGDVLVIRFLSPPSGRQSWGSKVQNGLFVIKSLILGELQK